MYHCHIARGNKRCFSVMLPEVVKSWDVSKHVRTEYL
jgi:hypothetical protein